jgi:hypothetical protein
MQILYNSHFWAFTHTISFTGDTLPAFAHPVKILPYSAGLSWLTMVFHFSDLHLISKYIRS